MAVAFFAKSIVDNSLRAFDCEVCSEGATPHTFGEYVAKRYIAYSVLIHTIKSSYIFLLNPKIYIFKIIKFAVHLGHTIFPPDQTTKRIGTRQNYHVMFPLSI